MPAIQANANAVITPSSQPNAVSLTPAGTAMPVNSINTVQHDMATVQPYHAPTVPPVAVTATPFRLLTSVVSEYVSSSWVGDVVASIQTYLGRSSKEKTLESIAQKAPTNHANTAAKKTKRDIAASYSGTRQLSECVQDTYEPDLELPDYVTVHNVTNHCKDKIIRGHIKIKCLKEQTKPHKFTLQGIGSTVTTELLNANECNNAISVQQKEKFTFKNRHKIRPCFHDYYAKNQDGTVSHRVTVAKRCKAQEYTSGYVKKDCIVDFPKSEYFRLRFEQGEMDGALDFTTFNTARCHNPVRMGAPDRHLSDKLCALHLPFHPTDFKTKSSQAALNADGVIAIQGDPLPSPESIVAGNPIAKKKAAHLVYVESAEIGRCSGTLISDRHVLTAAHCLKKAGTDEATALDKIKVRHDPIKLGGIEPVWATDQHIPGTRHAIVAAHIHPSYCQLNNHDLALLELKKPILNAKPIMIANQADFCDFGQTALYEMEKTCPSFPDTCTARHDRTQRVWKDGNAKIQGFGKQWNFLGKLGNSGFAQEASVVVTNIIGEEAEGYIVSMPTTDGENVCKGDSGGPLIHERTDGQRVQVGVASSSEPDCIGTSYFANLKNPSNRHFIQTRMQEHGNSTKISLGDRTRLRASPESCVKVSDNYDGFWGMFSGQRKITFTNHCHERNHPKDATIRFYPTAQEKVQTANIGQTGANYTTNMISLKLGETKSFYAHGHKITPKLTWADLEATPCANELEAQHQSKK